MPALEIPENLGIAGFSVISVCFTMLYLGGKVGAARKKAGVEYPTMYADEKVSDEKTRKLNHWFNCVQRGHQNAVEGVSMQLAFSALGAFKHPLLVAAGNLLWVVGRVSYQHGYASKGPKGRMAGALIFHLGELLALGAAFSFCLQYVQLDRLIR